MPRVPYWQPSNPVASILTAGSAEAPAREGKWNSGCMKAARSWNATQSADGFSFHLFFRQEGSNLDRLVLITEEAPGYRIYTEGLFLIYVIVYQTKCAMNNKIWAIKPSVS